MFPFFFTFFYLSFRNFVIQKPVSPSIMVIMRRWAHMSVNYEKFTITTKRNFQNTIIECLKLSKKKPTGADVPQELVRNSAWTRTGHRSSQSTKEASYLFLLQTINISYLKISIHLIDHHYIYFQMIESLVLLTPFFKKR